jgi:LysM repeat protein
MFIFWRRVPHILAGLSILLVYSLADAKPPPGQFILEGEGDRYSLEANKAQLSEILRALEERTGVQIRSFSETNAQVYARYYDLPLGEILDKLNISYVLSYERDLSGGYQLADAILFDKGDPLVDPTLRRELAELVGALADDNTPGNAERGRQRIVKLGAEAIPMLELTLSSSDYQARQFAADILRRLGEKYQPTPRFYEVMIEGLQHDGYPYGQRSDGTPCFTWLKNALTGYGFFMGEPSRVDQAESLLANGLYSDDGQQRLLCALILGQNQKMAYTARIVAVLAPHLEDNHLTSDGGLAAYALYRLGPVARPHLSPYVQSDQEQQATLAREVIDHLDRAGPGSKYAEWSRRVPSLQPGDWQPGRFPDVNGNYHYVQPTYDQADKASPSDEGVKEYTVQSQDTIDSLSARFGVSGSKLRDLNGLNRRGPVEPGTILLIPPSPGPDSGNDSYTGIDAEEPLLYTMLEGDTLESISKLFLVKEEDLIRLNGFPGPGVLKPGMRIAIPPPEL